MVAQRGPASGGRMVAVLGPTNTGKTHLAVERMLGHASGMIGLPLRLLAREIYDRVLQQKGPGEVALITGEEKITPPHARYFICTVEAMPLDRQVEFLAVDEIQLAGDAERGHVFTQRLLSARGASETMLLGADTMRQSIRRLLPGTEFIARPRFSTLSYAGEKKLSRLPRRSAVIAFAAADVYAMGELLRRQRGGAAIVLGALSPRTRNAQVALYQSGEVDFLVATDAIGMGLNMHVDHVAFAALRKFDGLHHRALTAAEIGQIAGRAGRHMNDGSFGTTAGLGPLPAELVEQVEHHRFDPVERLHWRSDRLDFASLPALLASLGAAPTVEGLVKAREADDVLALRGLGEEPETAARIRHRAALRLLWEVCQIPDFRKAGREPHHRILRRVFHHLTDSKARLPAAWLEREFQHIDRADGDIDTLAQRLTQVRTWSFIAHRVDWLDDARGWQERARAVENRLSDALHAALTQRFVDRRTAILLRQLRDKRDLLAAVTAEGDVLVEGQFVGRLSGLSFRADAAAPGGEARIVRAAANRVLGREVERLAAALAEAPDAEIAWRDDNRLWWRGAPVARLTPGDSILRPRPQLLPAEHLSGLLAERVRQHLARWLDRQIGQALGSLLAEVPTELEGAGRGLVFQLAEGLGMVRRDAVQTLVASLGGEARRALHRRGTRLGRHYVFLPALLRPERQRLRALLWAVQGSVDTLPPVPAPGLVAPPLAAEVPRAFYLACGYVACGDRAIRVDMLERFAAACAAAEREGCLRPDGKLASLLGLSLEQLPPILRQLDYLAETTASGDSYRRKRRRRAKLRAATAPSPFAALAGLAGGKQR